MESQTILSRFYATKEEITSCDHHHTATHHSYDTVVLNLQEVDLWNKFNQVTNEMIVTKSGR